MPGPSRSTINPSLDLDSEFNTTPAKIEFKLRGVKPATISTGKSHSPKDTRRNLIYNPL